MPEDDDARQPEEALCPLADLCSEPRCAVPSVAAPPVQEGTGNRFGHSASVRAGGVRPPGARSTHQLLATLSRVCGEPGSDELGAAGTSERVRAACARALDDTAARPPGAIAGCALGGRVNYVLCETARARAGLCCEARSADGEPQCRWPAATIVAAAAMVVIALCALALAVHSALVVKRRLGRDQCSVADVCGCLRQMASQCLCLSADGVPPYWSLAQSSATKALHFNDDLRTALVRLPADEGQCQCFGLSQGQRTFRALRRFLESDKVDQLNRGRDAAYDFRSCGLRLAAAWRVENPSAWRKYASNCADVRHDVRRAQDHGYRFPRFRSRLHEVARAMPGHLDAGVHEEMLLHGTKPEVVAQLVSYGFNERFSTVSQFGEGNYFAEDVVKIDQYATFDSGRGTDTDLHRYLFPAGDHPGDVKFAFVARVALGCMVRTKWGPSRAPKDLDSGSDVYASSTGTRELAYVPVDSDLQGARVLYHSLLVELGGAIARFREFVSFHSSYAYPEYLVAYQHVDAEGKVIRAPARR